VLLSKQVLREFRYRFSFLDFDWMRILKQWSLYSKNHRSIRKQLAARSSFKCKFSETKRRHKGNKMPSGKSPWVKNSISDKHLRKRPLLACGRVYETRQGEERWLGGTFERIYRSFGLPFTVTCTLKLKQLIGSYYLFSYLELPIYHIVYRFWFITGVQTF
jgi:hypothetical protein